MELEFILNYLNDYLMLIVSLIGSIIIFITSPILFLINLKRNKKFKEAKTIVITGAGSGLGESLALKYASSGKGVKLALIGRDKQKLQKVKEQCLKNGADYIEAISIDVRNKEALNQFLNDFNKRNPIDIVYANAAVTELMLPRELSFSERSYTITDVNINGLLNTVLPCIEMFENRGSGQIVMISSVGPMTNLMFPTYNGTKAFVTSFGLTLRNRLVESGVGVSVVVPGYIETPMADALEQKDLIFSISPDSAATIILNEVQSNKAMISFTRRMFLLSYFFSLIPPNFRDAFNFIISKFISFPDHNKPINKKNN